MARTINLSHAEESALQSLSFGFSDFIEPLVLDSLIQRGLARARMHWSGNDYHELTPFGEEVLAAIEEPEEGYATPVW